jgi:hypothetical protein
VDVGKRVWLRAEFLMWWMRYGGWWRGLIAGFLLGYAMTIRYTAVIKDGAWREVGAVALEHRLAGAIAEEEARLERAHVEELRGLARLVGVLARRADADPRAFLELARQREILRRLLARDETAGRGLRIDAGLDRPGRRRRRSECGRGIGEIVLVDLQFAAADVDRDLGGEVELVLGGLGGRRRSGLCARHRLRAGRGRWLDARAGGAGTHRGFGRGTAGVCRCLGCGGSPDHGALANRCRAGRHLST